jgi:hypothetical protein
MFPTGVNRPFTRLREDIMSMSAFTNMSFSPEAEIARQIEDLLRKMAKGEATQSDIQLLQDLQRRRVDLMSPRFPSDRGRTQSRTT